MTHTLPVSILMFGTIAAGLLIGVMLLLRFHRRHDSHPMKDVRERNIAQVLDDPRGRR